MQVWICLWLIDCAPLANDRAKVFRSPPLPSSRPSALPSLPPTQRTAHPMPAGLPRPDLPLALASRVAVEPIAALTAAPMSGVDWSRAACSTMTMCSTVQDGIGFDMPQA